jgi:hypothetical protein
MPAPPPLPEYRVSHQGTIRGPFPLLFLEAMVLAGHFPRDVKVMPSSGGAWTPLSAELGESPTAKPQGSKVPDTKTVLTWIFSLAAIAGVAAFIGAIVVSENVKKEETRRAARLAAAATPAPTPRYTPPAIPSSTPASYSSSSSSYLANKPITLPASTPEVRRAIAAGTPSSPTAPENSSSFHTGADGQTFRVSAAANSRLQQMQTKLDAEKALIEQQKQSLDKMEQDIERSRRSVNRSSQTSINRFNARISDYNNQAQNLDMAIDRFNRKIEEYNAELRRVGTPIR